MRFVCYTILCITLCITNHDFRVFCVTERASVTSVSRNEKADNRLIISFLLGAENETRTRDPDLGKVVLYQLSYCRLLCLKSEEEETRTPTSQLTLPPQSSASASLCQGCSMIQADLFLHAAYTIFVPMKTPVDIWAELGARLSSFGQDAASREVIARACQKNDWFEPEEIVDAVRSIREEFLSRDKIERWLACYERPATLPSRTVLVVMAGNIPLVGFFDLLCVVTAGHRCLVKMSSKDAVLMSFVIDQLKKIEPGVPVAVYDGATPFDAAIATGSDNANRYFRSLYAGVRTLLRGNRHSVAVLNGRETSGQLEALSDDIFSYSGLGCRNVSLIFVPRGISLRFASRRMNPKYLNNYRQRKALREMCGDPFFDLGFALLIRQSEFSQALSEVSVVEYDDLSQVAAWLRKHDAELQCVVSNCIDHSRRVPLGRSQQPTLSDYPDAVDVMEFLYGL